MTNSERQFIELLRSGIWNEKADPDLFKGPIDWKAILKTASQQTVLLIVADGIETLPKDIWPPKEVIYRIVMARSKNTQTHHMMNRTINKVVSKLRDNGIPSVLLKGQGVAANYLIPKSRSCGDIDLYVGCNNYTNACKIVTSLQKDLIEEGVESTHHMHLCIDDIIVEIHRKVDFMPGRKLDNDLQEWTIKSIDNNFYSNRLLRWNNSGTEILLAPATFDAFYIFHHAVRHLTVEGLGLRQICDWTMYMHINFPRIDIQELYGKLKKYHLIEVWNEFRSLAINVLGGKPECIPDFGRGKKTDLFTELILASGNFGVNENKRKSNSETTFLKRKWRSFKFQSSRLIKLQHLFPKYVITYGIAWIYEAIKDIINYVIKQNDTIVGRS